MEIISTSNAPAAIGPYSQGMKAGGFVFTSGQIPADPETGAIVGDTIVEQAEQSCKNVGAVLEAGGSSFAQVVKTTCFLADMGDFPTFNGIYEKYFVSKPARSCVAVRSLPKGVLCEIEAVAVVGER
jgi:2-iminobutanoate/2-iminopropanoate deaminase